MPRCPVCGDPVEPANASTTPFCGDRCRTIDLGRWLGETYALPESPRHEDDDVEAFAGEE